MTTLFLFYLLVMALCLVFLIRNESVFRARVSILDVEPVTLGLLLHRSLPSYDAMLFNPKYWTLWTARHWLAWIERHQTVETVSRS